MMRLSFVLCSALFAAAGSVTAQDGGAKPPAPAAPKFPVGVVDFVKVFDAYPRAVQEENALKDFNRRQQEVLDAEERKLEQLKIQRDNYNKGSRDYAMKDNELRAKLRELEGLQEILRVEFGQKRNEFMNTIYADIGRAIAIVAKERDVKLVLRRHPPLDGLSSGQNAQLNEARQVWYAAEELDLTPHVIKLLQVGLPELPKASDAQDSGARSTTEKNAGGN